MTQAPNPAALLTHLQAHARRVASPLVTPEQDAAWERYTTAAALVIAQIIAALVSGKLTVRDFQRLMTHQVREAQTVGYGIGHGGLSTLTPADQQAIRQRSDDQLKYLLLWVAQLTASGLASEALMRARASLYVDAGQAAVSAGAAADYGIQLPAQIGEGSPCRGFCYCSWHVQRVDSHTVHAFWVLGRPETGHCAICPRRAIAWSPVVNIDGVLQPHLRAGLFV